MSGKTNFGPTNLQMKSGDSLTLEVKFGDDIKKVNVIVQGYVIMIEDEEAKDAFLIKPSGNVLVKC